MIDDKHTGFAKVSLDHWRALEKVVDKGGYARAAEALGKSQSTVSHSIQRLEELLGAHKQAAVALGLLTEEKFDELVRPEEMTGPKA